MTESETKEGNCRKEEKRRWKGGKEKMGRWRMDGEKVKKRKVHMQSQNEGEGGGKEA